MKSALEQLESLDYVIRQLHKIDSMMHSGQFIDANRCQRSIIAFLENNRKLVLKDGIEPNAKTFADLSLSSELLGASVRTVSDPKGPALYDMDDEGTAK